VLGNYEGTRKATCLLGSCLSQWRAAAAAAAATLAAAIPRHNSWALLRLQSGQAGCSLPVVLLRRVCSFPATEDARYSYRAAERRLVSARTPAAAAAAASAATASRRLRRLQQQVQVGAT
jgi:hypothetical protein